MQLEYTEKEDSYFRAKEVRQNCMSLIFQNFTGFALAPRNHRWACDHLYFQMARLFGGWSPSLAQPPPMCSHFKYKSPIVFLHVMFLSFVLYWPQDLQILSSHACDT